MKKLRFLVSLVTTDNDYQMEQAEVAEQTARRLGVDIEIIYAESDAITQSQQLLRIIQTRSVSLPDGIIFEPVGGTALPQVARAAVSAGVAWVVMNRETDYVAELRRTASVPVFSITSDHEEIGRIQGKQMAALLPHGGSVLYIQGPSENTAAKQRSAGMYETKPADIQVKAMKGNWTEGSAYKTVSSWLRLSTSRQTPLDVIAAQNDVMAVGAKKAFQESSDIALRDHWLHLPYIGVDGVSKTGQTWVKRGLLAATIVVPPNTGKAIEMLAHALQTSTLPAERTLTVPRSLPSIEELAAAQTEKARTLSI
jgi:ABC-type sugar transport system substrate-binding protein